MPVRSYATKPIFDFLEHRFHCHDHRPAQLGETVAATRQFLAHGGRLMLNREGQLESNLPFEAIYPDVSDGSAARAAGREFLRVRCRYKNIPVLQRIVRMLGVRLDNGWVLLKAKPPAKRRRKLLSLRHGASA